MEEKKERRKAIASLPHKKGGVKIFHRVRNKLQKHIKLFVIKNTHRESRIVFKSQRRQKGLLSTSNTTHAHLGCCCWIAADTEYFECKAGLELNMSARLDEGYKLKACAIL
jgi:hypothetical protein